MPCLHKLKLTVLSFLLISVQNSCGTLAGNPEDDHASVQFFIADAPVDQLKHVYVAISGLDVLDKSGKWISVQLTETSAIDLLSYQDGSSLKFADANLVEGDYQQLRLKLSEEISPYVIEQDGKKEALKVPSGISSGIKIHHAFSISSSNKDQPLSLVIDLDLRQSIVMRGEENNQKEKYLLNPVLRLVDKAKVGAIEGKASNGQTICLYKAGKAKDEQNNCPNAVTSVISKNNKFKIAHVEAGSYDLRVFTSTQSYKDSNGLVVKEKKSTLKNVDQVE